MLHWVLALMGNQPDKLISHLATLAPWPDRLLQPAICVSFHLHCCVVLLSLYHLSLPAIKNSRQWVKCYIWNILYRLELLYSNYLHPDCTNFICKVVPICVGHKPAKCFSCHRDGHSSAFGWGGLFGVVFLCSLY